MLGFRQLQHLQMWCILHIWMGFAFKLSSDYGGGYGILPRFTKLARLLALPLQSMSFAFCWFKRKVPKKVTNSSWWLQDEPQEPAVPPARGCSSSRATVSIRLSRVPRFTIDTKVKIVLQTREPWTIKCLGGYCAQVYALTLGQFQLPTTTGSQCLLRLERNCPN